MTKARMAEVKEQVAIHATPGLHSDADLDLELNRAHTNDISFSPSSHTCTPAQARSEFYETGGQIYTSWNNRPVSFSVGNHATYDLEHRNNIEQQTFLHAIETWGLLDPENVGRQLLECMDLIQDLAEAEAEEADEQVNHAHSGMF
jgi:hypothetical protein